MVGQAVAVAVAVAVVEDATAQAVLPSPAAGLEPRVHRGYPCGWCGMSCTLSSLSSPCGEGS